MNIIVTAVINALSFAHLGHINGPYVDQRGVTKLSILTGHAWTPTATVK